MLQGSNQCGRDGLIAILRHNFVTTVCGQQCCNRRREMRMLGNLGKQIGCYKAGREQQRSRRARQGRQRQLERALRGEKQRRTTAAADRATSKRQFRAHQATVMCTAACTFKMAQAQRPAAPKPAEALPKPNPRLQQQPVKHHQRGDVTREGGSDCAAQILPVTPSSGVGDDAPLAQK